MSQVLEARAPLDLRWLRVAGGALVILVLVHEVGAEPLVDGLRATSPWAVLAALVLTAGTTWCCAVRWSLVSARLGSAVPALAAYKAYYRSQLINATLPGGVVGDVQRSLRHGWRGVLLERGIGQVVQVGLVGALLLPGGWRWPGLGAVLLVVLLGGSAAVLSALSTTGHLLVFLLAAASVGVDLPLSTLVTVGALVLLGSSIPLNVAGWGPREGVAVGAFTAYGASATTGLTVAVTFGVLATIAVLPGLVFLGARRD
ncbi:MAG: lysylphosphatidylglycerol synthase domain-containing protein [Marmoricola sp.]